MTDAEQTHSPERILIIDDSSDNRMLLASQLKMRGYQILQASDGESGIEIAQRENPDLILLDVMMPGIDGFVVCSRLKSDPQTAAIPIVMVTALRDVEYRIKGIEAGADEFLSRPHHREELLVRVRALIQLRQARNRLEEERNRLQLLYDVSRATNTQLDLSQMMGHIITHTQNAVGANKGSILLLDEKGEVNLKILIRKGQNVEVAGTVTREVISHGLAGWLIRHNKAEIINDISQDPRWITLPGHEQSTGSVIGIPLSKADSIVGLLLLTHPETGYFKKEHMDLLITIGAQTTAAIENAYLFAETNEQRRKLEAILAQSTDAIITTDESRRVTMLNQAGEQLFDLQNKRISGQSLLAIEELRRLTRLFEKAVNRPISEEVQLNGDRILYASVSPIRDVGYVAVMQDITELKRLEKMRLEQERREKQRVKETFSRYMGPRLVEHVLTTKPSLLARREKRRAVVMFADLRGFTRMIVRVEPDMAILTLNEFFSSMTDIVHEYDGTIFDLAGDELMVGFNVPLDQPDASYRALLAAVTMQKQFRRLQKEWLGRLGAEMGLGIGIDQGEVIVGNVGAETRMNFAMVGEAVNTAHRLVELAEDTQIVISETIYRSLYQESSELLDRLGFYSVGEVTLRGKSRPQKLFCAEIKSEPDNE